MPDFTEFKQSLISEEIAKIESKIRSIPDSNFEDHRKIRLLTEKITDLKGGKIPLNLRYLLQSEEEYSRLEKEITNWEGNWQKAESLHKEVKDLLDNRKIIYNVYRHQKLLRLIHKCL